MRTLVGLEIRVIEHEEGCGEDEIEVPLQVMIDRLIAARDEVPAERREHAVFRITAYGDYAAAYANVVY